MVTSRTLQLDENPLQLTTICPCKQVADSAARTGLMLMLRTLVVFHQLLHQPLVVIRMFPWMDQVTRRWSVATRRTWR